MSKSKTSTPDHTISYYPATKARLKAPDPILEDRLLHKVFLTAYIPATWSGWQMALGLGVVTGLVYLIWVLWGQVAMAATATLIYALFALGDWLLLWWLPHSKRSYGESGSHLFVLTLPRLGVVFFAAALSWLAGYPLLGLGLHLFLQLCGTLVYLWGTLYEPFALSTTQQTVQCSALPRNSAPIRLLHLSDMHVERLTRREAQLLTLVEEAQADVIVITGDFLNLSYVDEPLARAEVRKVLQQLKAPYGVYATLGSPPADPRNTTPALFEDTAIRLLRDEVALIDFGDGRRLSLLGMDCTHEVEPDCAIFENLMALAPADSMRVLLYHSPEMMPQAQHYPLDLYLCGHTHGGQVRMPFYGAIITSSITGKQYEMGRYEEQGTTLYISRGIGLEGLSAPRLRLLCRPEIILFNLTWTS